MKMFSNDRGFGLIELTVIIIIVGILTAVAMQSMTSMVQDARQIKTEREMEMLADAIVGNTELTSNGIRSDFGYVGDVGAFPPNLQALYQNPGSYATWDGPYIETGFSQDTDGFNKDEWGTDYNYTGGITITSTGSGSTVTKKIANATPDYLLNTFNGTIKDGYGLPPGSVYHDSIDIKITIPNGVGGTVTKTYYADAAGVFALDSLPVGQHALEIIFTPDVDTLHRYLTILPRHKSSATYIFADNHFSAGSSGPGTVIYEEFTEVKRAPGGTSVTVSTPPGTTGGDLLIAAVITDASETISPPGGEGWTLIDIGSGSSAVTLGVWWKLAEISESGTHQFNWGTWETAYAFMMRFTGHDATSPINSSAVNGGNNSSSPPSPSATTTAANTMIVRIGGFDDDDISVDNTGLAGYTDITMDRSNWGSGTCSGGAGYVTMAAIGSSGTSNFSLIANEQWRTVTIAIAPSP